MHPLSGDFLQEAQVRELARIIDEESGIWYIDKQRERHGKIQHGEIGT